MHLWWKGYREMQLGTPWPLTLSISGLGSESESVHFSEFNFTVLPLQTTLTRPTKWDIMTTIEHTNTDYPHPSLSKTHILSQRRPKCICEVNDPSLLGVPLIGSLFESCIEVTGHYFPVAYIKLMRIEEESERKGIVTSQWDGICSSVLAIETLWRHISECDWTML